MLPTVGGQSVENLLLVEARPMILTSLKNHNDQMLLWSEALNSAVKVKDHDVVFSMRSGQLRGAPCE